MAPRDHTVPITGATGYVGGQILREALEKGYRVRIAVRTAASGEQALARYPAAQASGQLAAVAVPDITRAESYRDALGGVTDIVHTASPLVLAPKDNVRDLLDPAMQGSVAVLEAARHWGEPGLARVVATSSFAAINDVARGARPGYRYDEHDWNPITFEAAAREPDGVAAYCASKALAERAMWDWIAANKPSFSLTTICPPWVFGPYAHTPKGTGRLSESVHLLWDIIETKKIPPFDFGGYADSREVAEAHILALEVPEAAGETKRFLVGQNFRYQTAVDLVRDKLPTLGLPKGNPGSVEPAAYTVDGSKASRVLGLRYRTLEASVTDMFVQLLEASRIEKQQAAN